MNKRILVVDDSPSVRQQVAMCLEQGGYQVVEANDGVEGLERLGGCAMAICDVNMPRMGGIEFAEKAAGAVPIVMLTTEGRAELIAKARAAGAKGWMVKPFKPEQLLSAVKKIVG
ncbi:MAG: response regulator [Myxococcaceae bacterium]|jgi:two-component system chemotaxis response regulator CheY|nr:response regulator [Myxococcaceae bacterium]